MNARVEQNCCSANTRETSLEVPGNLEYGTNTTKCQLRKCSEFFSELNLFVMLFQEFFLQYFLVFGKFEVHRIFGHFRTFFRQSPTSAAVFWIQFYKHKGLCPHSFRVLDIRFESAVIIVQSHFPGTLVNFVEVVEFLPKSGWSFFFKIVWSVISSLRKSLRVQVL